MGGFMRCLFIIFHLLVFSVLSGQELMPVQNFPPDVYRGETQNWKISQSPEKFMYVANNKGLLEFNGATWKLYPTPNQSIMRSVNAEGDKIYTGCYMDFGYWERDEFFNLRYTSLCEKIKDKLPEDENFWKIICYHQWVLFQSLHGIYIYDTGHDTFEIISSQTNLPKVFEVGNQIYFQRIDAGLFQLENGKSTLVSDAPVFRENVIINIFPFKGNLLVETQEKGFFIVSGSSVSKWETENSSRINSLSVYSSLQLKDGRFALGTIGEGVYFLSPEGKITMHMDRKNGLQNNTVLSMYEDAGGNIWLGLDNGISVINYTSPYRVYTDTKGIFGTVYAAEYDQGYLYLGTNQGLYSRPIGSEEDFKILEGTKGQVWRLVHIDGTFFCGHNTGTFVIKENKAILISDILGTWDIKPMPGYGNLLLQGNYEGLHILEKKNARWQYRNKIEGFDVSCRFFELMPDNQIFVKRKFEGIHILDISADFRKVLHFQKEESVPVSFNSGMSEFNGKLFYFDDSGFYGFNLQSKQFQKELSIKELVVDEDAYLSGYMVADDNQYLWAFTEDNILAISPGRIDNKLQITRIALPLSLRENVIDYENLFYAGNREYLLGNKNGYILFNLDKITEKESSVSINSIEKITLRGKADYIPVAGKNYKLKARENNLTFSYSVPVYDRFVLTRYQYTLEGRIDRWSNWIRDSKVSFNNLPPGDYTFRVRARIGNKLTENEATFAFYIAKPWYTSNWMIAVYLLMFVSLFLAVRNRYRNQYLKHKVKIEKDKQQELAIMQLENEATLAKLKSEKLKSEVEAKNKELVSSAMAIVKKNELLNMLETELKQKNPDIKSALKIIKENLSGDSDWEIFQEAFNQADRDFLKKIKDTHPLLTPNDLKLCVYLRLNLSSKEIAPMLNISPQSVEIKRFRLRKKLELDHEQNLTEYILNL
jgi:AraC family transcriptional regulator, chitin signaling transcriptional activator